MRKASAWTLLGITLLLADMAPGNCAAAYQKTTRRVAARSVTGSYKYVLNTLDVLELPDHKVRISFTGCWPNDHSRVETRNMGSFDEIVPLSGHTAVVKPEYGHECAITLDFRANRVIVTQDGYSCGFGFNVEAEGTYRKVSSKPPELPPLERPPSE